MELLFLYWSMLIAGYFSGSRLRRFKSRLGWISGLLFIAIGVLVFLMGARMGANKEVIKNLGTIGLYAFLMTIVIIAGSVGAVWITRKILFIDKFGHYSRFSPQRRMP